MELIAPDVEVSDSAPVVIVKPLEAIRVEEEVKVPVLFVDPTMVVFPEEST